MWYSYTMPTSQHRNAFRVIGTLQLESMGHKWADHTKDSLIQSVSVLSAVTWGKLLTKLSSCQDLGLHDVYRVIL